MAGVGSISARRSLSRKAWRSGLSGKCSRFRTAGSEMGTSPMHEGFVALRRHWTALGVRGDHTGHDGYGGSAINWGVYVPKESLPQLEQLAQDAVGLTPRTNENGRSRFSYLHSSSLRKGLARESKNHATDRPISLRAKGRVEAGPPEVRKPPQIRRSSVFMTDNQAIAAARHVIFGRIGADSAYRLTCSRQRNLDLTASAHMDLSSQEATLW